MKKRLFIVSNRLPVTVENKDGVVEAKPSSGGLVSAVNSYLSQQPADEFAEVSWVGVPGCGKEDWNTAAREIASTGYNYIPVYLAEKTYEEYYNGFSNSSIWPLFHYFPSFTEYDRNAFSSYVQANTAFAETLLKHLRPGDVVWIHDYHLMSLPNMLRQQLEQLTIGFFLHIPFPSYELFRLLPKQWQHELLTGMMGADLIGFHTIDYTTHFLKTVQMVLGIEHDMNILRYRNRLVKADVFPISIDFEKFNNAFDNEKVAALRKLLHKKFPGKQLIFSVDRLDYTKGLSNRLEGYRFFLEKNPSYKDKVVFVMVIVPSREYIPRYAERKKMIDEMIGNINSKTGNLHWQPVIYQYNSLSFEEMLALYTGCDMALITPLRDGMNLVAKEFAASRSDKKGVLVLSEMAGAARELTTALQLNPNDIEELAATIKAGLEMDEAEQATRIEAMQQRISQYNVQSWASDFLTQLELVKTKQQQFQVKFIDNADKRLIFSSYRSAARRLFLLDYDGTLVPFRSMPETAVPSPHVKSILDLLGRDPLNEVYIISGRTSSMLESWFDGLPVHLVAEHGARRRLNGKWEDLVTVSQDWQTQTVKTMEQYVRRCPNSFMEKKQYSVVWHYRNSDPQQAKLRARELFNEMHEYSAQLGLQVIMGNKIVEARLNGASKANFLKQHLSLSMYDFILAAGDDRTDEDMFRCLSNVGSAFSIKVGPEASYAKYNLMTSEMVLAILDSLSHLPPEIRPVMSSPAPGSRGLIHRADEWRVQGI